MMMTLTGLDNQGMFAQVLTMKSFQDAVCEILRVLCRIY